MEEGKIEAVRTREGRRHSDEFRAAVLAACEVPGAQVSKVAVAYGVNVSLLYKWRQRSGRAKVVSKTNIQRPPSAFVPISIEADSCSVPPEPEAFIVPIAIELTRRDVTVRLSWSGQDIDRVVQLVRGVLQ